MFTKFNGNVENVVTIKRKCTTLTDDSRFHYTWNTFNCLWRHPSNFARLNIQLFLNFWQKQTKPELTSLLNKLQRHLESNLSHRLERPLSVNCAIPISYLGFNKIDISLQTLTILSCLGHHPQSPFCFKNKTHLTNDSL